MFNNLAKNSKKLGWLYASITSILIVLFVVILIHHQIIEIFDARLVYVVFILIGILGFSLHLSKQSEKSISLINIFKKCFRTGIYILLTLFLIALIIFTTTSHIQIMEQGGGVSEESSRIGLFISMGIEIFATILISSFIAAFIPGIFGKRKKPS
jgi:hypothetical protein